MKIQNSNPVFDTSLTNKLDKQISSGKRVNSAADDNSALQIINRMNSKQEGYNQAVRNAYDGISLTQTADSALQGVGDAVERIRELSIQAGNGVLTDSDRLALQDEVAQLQSQISETFENTTFGGTKLFSGQTSSFQIGAEAGSSKSAVFTNGSFANGIMNVDISTQTGAQAAIDSVDDIKDSISNERAKFGAFENTLSSTIRALGTQAENVEASKSRISDTDYARVISDRVSNDILQKAKVAINAQASKASTNVLNLL
ncbi:flagellin [Pseudoalteromonas xiamenensis]|uniref:flagellin N-terminal helical domain-containing protein n=1 Tax=Pseudoalteromonas xiamenensis TaxID=882626 RepID=UPI0027E445EA|nr:flagellin [Pseudoalteromonas xiamenensis]WMN59388.1 flagellin [Pseudoalteromonas xiamenensis]